jgi:hypothetical protein
MSIVNVVLLGSPSRVGVFIMIFIVRIAHADVLLSGEAQGGC